MFYWIYDIPNLALAALIAVVCITYTCAGLLILRPIVRNRIGSQPGSNDFVNYIFAAFVVFYGLMLGLIAVATYENYSEVEAIVSKEATTLDALYRDVSAYPEPARSINQKHIRDFLQFLIDEAWPEQQGGIIPTGGNVRVTNFQRDLFAFQPKTKTEEILHLETIRQFNTFLEARAERLLSVKTALPDLLWFVVTLGAALNLSLLWFFSIDKLSVQLILSSILSSFVGLMLFFIAAMDNPFRGTVSISSEAYQMVQKRIALQSVSNIPKP